MPTAPLYLGLDLSTQSMSALVIDPISGDVVAQESVNFGQELPQYKAPSGFVQGALEGEVFSSPSMWLEALDLALEKLSAKVELKRIAAISGSGQQHASVYLNEQFQSRLAQLDTKQSLKANLENGFSRELSPIWMDNSTHTQCEDIATSMGGNEQVLAKTGSVMIERFTGAQIRKFFKQQPEAYAQTATIHLASSFCCSVMAGKNASIDYGDGAGMNLMNLDAQDWDADLLEATASQLAAKLPDLKPSNQAIGTIAPYFVEKYGFESGCMVYSFSGDNPNSLIGCGGAQAGTAVISLGTSDTFFAAMQQPLFDPQGFGHVFGNPAGGYMSLICFMNGSLMREKICQAFHYDWGQFSQALTNYNSEQVNIQLPWLNDEITPKTPKNQQAIEALTQAVIDNDPSIIRGFIEGQFINMYLQSQWMGESIARIIVTGGASKNTQLVQIIADIFQTPIDRLEVANSAALGAAMRACQAHTNSSWDKVTQKFVNFDNGSRCEPRAYDISKKIQEFKALR